MACVSKGPIEVRLSQDEDGHRTYTVPFLVEGVPGVDGPNSARNAVGLPSPGRVWDGAGVFSGEGDECAWCRPTSEVVKHPNTKTGENPQFWIVTKTYSTKHQDPGRERCVDAEICDPLQEPQKVRIQYSRFTEEASYDRFGRRILSSSLEPIHGPNNEWEFTRTTVVIEQKVADPQLELIEAMKDSVNAQELWGFPPRTIKFTPISNDRFFHNLENPLGTLPGECTAYWTRQLSFEIKFRRREGVQSSTNTGTGIELTPVPGGPYETWDRDVWDEGTRVLRGHWSNASGQPGTGTSSRTHWTLIDIDGQEPDPTNPQHFIRFKDWNGENTRTLLDGRGKPAFIKTVTYKWWLLQEEYTDNGMTYTASYEILHLPCASALTYAENTAALGNISNLSLYGPYDTEQEARDEIGGPSGSPVTTCDEDDATVGVVHISKYGGSDFLLLGIPYDLKIPMPPFTTP